MEARILDLDGKYYGTTIEIINDKDSTYLMKLWGGSGTPSERELSGICSIKQWENNMPIWAIDFDGKAVKIPAREVFEICDDHYETQETYELATMICTALNKKGD